LPGRAALVRAALDAATVFPTVRPDRTARQPDRAGRGSALALPGCGRLPLRSVSRLLLP
jgi:hypothetical protein